MIQKDSVTAQFCMIRLILFILLNFNFSVATVDVKLAYLQVDDLLRTIHIRPPEIRTYSPYTV